MPTSHSRLLHFGLILFALLITFFYGLSGEFVLDDLPLVQNNLTIQTWNYFDDYFINPFWAMSSLQLQDDILYRPLVLSSFLLNYQLWEGDPFGYHLFNLLIHSCNTLLVYLLLDRLLKTSSCYIVFLGTLFFGLHPVHVESISWVSGVSDLLATLFILLGFLSYLYYHSSQQNRYLILSILAYAFALLSKEIGVILLVLIVAYDLLNKPSKFWQYLPFVLLLGGYLLLRAYVLQGANNTLQLTPDSFLNVTVYLIEYFKLMVLPWPLNLHLGSTDLSTFPLVGIVMGGGLIVLSTRYSLISFKRSETLPLFALLWFFITLGPSLLPAFYLEPRFALRFLYLPSVGFTFLLAYGVSRLDMPPTKVTHGIAVSMLLLFCSLCVVESRAWNNDELLMKKALEVGPEHGSNYLILANYYERNSDIPRAIENYLSSAKYSTGQQQIESLYKAAQNAAISGDILASEQYLMELLSLSPRHSNALVGRGNNAWALNDLERAIEFYQQALNAKPSNYEARNNLNMAYRQLRR